VGGIAVNLHGYMRNTADLDILVDMTDVNLAKVVKILKRHGYHVKQPVDPIAIADKNMKAFNFYKEDEFKEVDIIIKSALSYDRAKKNIKRVKIGDIVLPVIGLCNLMIMKRKSGRDLDKVDLKALKKIGRLSKKK
jgi:hypothetical protein